MNNNAHRTFVLQSVRLRADLLHVLYKSQLLQPFLLRLRKNRHTRQPIKIAVRSSIPKTIISCHIAQNKLPICHTANDTIQAIAVV